MHGAYVIEDRKNHRTLLLSLAPPFFLTFSDMSTDLCRSISELLRGQPACALPLHRPKFASARFGQLVECDDRLEGAQMGHAPHLILSLVAG
jgi:hypothetical protein